MAEQSESTTRRTAQATLEDLDQHLVEAVAEGTHNKAMVHQAAIRADHTQGVVMAGSMVVVKEDHIPEDSNTQEEAPKVVAVMVSNNLIKAKVATQDERMTSLGPRHETGGQSCWTCFSRYPVWRESHKSFGLGFGLPQKALEFFPIQRDVEMQCLLLRGCLRRCFALPLYAVAEASLFQSI